VSYLKTDQMYITLMDVLLAKHDFISRDDLHSFRNLQTNYK